VIKRHIPALRNITATVEKLPALNLTLIPDFKSKMWEFDFDYKPLSVW